MGGVLKGLAFGNIVVFQVAGWAMIWGVAVGAKN